MLAVEEQVGLFAESEADGKAGRRHERGPPEHGGKRAGCLALPQRLGGDGVDGARELVVLDREPVDANEVVDVDPGKPLATAADRPAGKEADGERHQPERGSAPADDERRPDGEVTTGRGRRGRLPVDDQPGQERVPGRRGLVDDRVAGIAVVVDSRGGHEHGRALGRRFDRGGEQPVRLDAAAPQQLLAPRRPPRPADRGARQVDDRVGAVDLAAGSVPVDGSHGPGSRAAGDGDHLVAVAGERAGEGPADIARPAADHDLHRVTAPPSVVGRS